MEQGFLCMLVLAGGKGHVTQGLRGRGGYIHREGGCLSAGVGCGMLRPWKGWFSLERKSFRMELGLAKPSSHPSPSLGAG